MKQFQSFSTIAKEALLDSPDLTARHKSNSNNYATVTNTVTKPASTTLESENAKELDPRLDNVITNYNETESFIEVDIINPKIHEPTLHNDASSNHTTFNRFTDYEIVTRTNLPQFPKRISHVRRRYSDFELFRHFLKKEIQLNERLNKIKLPHLPSKLIWQNRFDPSVIEQRQKDLEQWIRFVASHPLIQTNCPTLIRFLQLENFTG